MRTVLKAQEGMILTNGTIFGREIYPAEGMDTGQFYEITEEAYLHLRAKEQEEQA